MRKILIYLFFYTCITTVAKAQTITGPGSGLNRPTTATATLALGGTVTAPTTLDFTTSTTANFLIKKGTANYFFVGNTGLVGIGNAAPATALDVSGTVKATAWLFPTGAGLNKILTSDASGNATWAANPGWLLTGNAATTTTNYIGTSDAQPLRLRTANADRLFINATGSIGIGNAAPTTMLDVSGTVKATGLILPTGAAAGKFLTSDATGLATWSTTLPVANGGTGLTTPLVLGDMLYADASNATAFTRLGIGTANQVLTVSSTTGKPVWANAAGGGAVTSVFGRAGLVVAAANDYTFAQIGAKPTTLLGYGITDAAASTHTHAIDVLSNVAIITPANGQVLTYNSTSTKWENKTPAAGGASQWTTSGSNIFYTAGNVGIGTSTPTEKLHVVGNITSPGTGSGSEKFGSLASVAANNFSVAIGPSATTIGNESVAVGYSANAAYGSSAFGSSARASGYASTIIGRGGNDNAVNYTTSVGANNTNSGYFAGGSFLNAGMINIGYNNNSAGFNSTYLIGANLTADRNSQMLIGNGLAGGGFLLDMVLGGGLSNPIAANYGSLSIRTTDGNGANSAGMSLSFKGGKSTGTAAGGVLSFFTTPAGTAGSTLNTEAERMHINATGNIGIGTTTPTERLDVAGNIYTNGKILINQANTAVVAPYSLAVNGSAIFTKAVVKLNASWPDYVFKPDYQLLPLPELENYLQQHKHLPNIPAAAEVEKNGIDLGGNQTLLLQKVEELTLYIIEQQKQIDELKKKIDKK